ncbi:LamG-like jellyroll fold domain-containing protein [Leifsonia xyli]|uniref:LamG-like jellyroll fold domain-containing protein n=1 Tax=Leifsonia xyli TaxID=1575 RepID=UPI0012FE2AC8
MTDYTTSLPPCDSVAGADARIVCAAADGTLALTVAPPSELATLWVAAYDRAGNVSCDSAEDACDTANATSSAGVGVATQGEIDLTSGHRWTAMDTDQASIDDALSNAKLKVGSIAGWEATNIFEDPQFLTPALVSLNRFVKPGVSHAVDSSENGTPAGHVLEMTLGQLAKVIPGQDAPLGSRALYICAYGLGKNMLSTYQNCEGTGAASRLLGYGWPSAESVPKQYSAREIFRCRVGTDYFVSLQSNCEGQINEGSRGFVAVFSATVSDQQVVDLRTTFSVSARVKPGSNQGTQSLVSAPGTRDSAFSLQSTNGSWQFCIRSQGPTKTSACATQPLAQVDTTKFVTVTGHWDAVNRRIGITLLIGNTAQGTQWASYVPPADNTAALSAITVGSAVSEGYPSSFFGGAVAGVAIYPSLLPEEASRQPLPGPNL